MEGQLPGPCGWVQRTSAHGRGGAAWEGSSVQIVLSEHEIHMLQAPHGRGRAGRGAGCQPPSPPHPRQPGSLSCRRRRRPEGFRRVRVHRGRGCGGGRVPSSEFPTLPLGCPSLSQASLPGAWDPQLSLPEQGGASWGHLPGKCTQMAPPLTSLTTARAWKRKRMQIPSGFQAGAQDGGCGAG